MTEIIDNGGSFGRSTPLHLLATRLILWRTGVQIDQLRGESYITSKVAMCTFTE
jgi:hypothetical protein